MKVLFAALMLTGITSWGQILSEGLNNSSGTLTVNSGAYYSGNSASSADSPSNSPYAVEGTHSYGKSNGSATITSADINTSTYTSLELSFRLASFSIASTANGADSSDAVIIAISPDGGTTWYNTLQIPGNANARWAFSATGTASTAYDGDANAVNFSTPAGLSTTGPSTVKVTGLPSVSNLRFRITMSNNDTSERWLVDDIKVTGALNTAPILAITGTTSHGSVCPNTAANSITYTITNSGAAAAAGVTAVSSDAQFVVSGLSSTTIAASGGTATFTVTFTPSSFGSKTATLTAASTTTNATSGTLGISGTGTTPVAQAVSVLAAQSITASSATIRGTLGTVGVCPATIEKGFVYSKVADNGNPAVGGSGVTKQVVTTGGITAADYTYGLTGLIAETAYNYKAYLYDGTTYTYSNLSTFTTTGTPPAITAAVGATVDAPFAITFTDNATWRANITSITVDGTTLSASAYNKTVSGQITFTPSASSLLQTAGTKSIVIISTNYTNATVSQTIGVGAPAKLALTTQPTAPLTNGGTLAAQPVVVIRDQYNNNTTSTAQVTAEATASTWTLAGGNTQINAVNGVATFSGLTAATPTGLTGATILFSSPSLTGVTSNTFSIPPSNDLCANPTAVTVNAGNVTGNMTGSTYTSISGVTSKKDVWYSFVAACTGDHTISVNTASGDMDIALYASCPTSATNLGQAVSSANPSVVTASLTQGATYYVRVYAFNTAAETSSFTIQVASAYAPAVTSVAATSIGTQGATIAGTATVSACSSAVTAYGVEYSTTNNFTQGTGTQVAGSNLSGGNFSVTLSNLVSGTTYYYRTYATNASGTTYSTPQLSFFTLTVPVTLPYVQNFDNNNAVNEWTFGTTGTNKWVIGTGTKQSGTQSLYISNTGTAYAYTTSSAVTDTYAEVSIDLTNVTAATLSFDWKSSGEVSASNGTVYDYGEVYINTGGSDIRISGDKEFVGISTYQNKVINLTPYVGGIRKLRFRWVNDGSGGTGLPFSVDNISVTSGALPTLTTTAITAINQASANTGGTISNDGGSAITARGVVYSTSATPTLATGTVVNSGTGTGTFITSLSGLQDNKKYYVRSFATNSTGTGYGDELNFTTLSMQAPVAANATNIDTDKFTANWAAVEGAQHYELDVSTSATFGNFTYPQLIEGFNTTATPSSYSTGTYTLSSGSWGLTDVLRSVNPDSSGETAAQLKGTTGKLLSPELANITSIVINAKKGGSDTSLNVYEVVNGVDNLLQSIALTNTAFTDYTINISSPKALSRIRIVIGSSAYGLVNNVTINYTAGSASYVTGYDHLVVNGLSQVVSGLNQNTFYYYRVRAVGQNTTSAVSNTISATTLKQNIWSSGAWSQGTPTASDKAVVQDNYNTATNGEFSAGILIINSGTFTITTGTNITVADAVVINNSMDSEGNIVGPQMIIQNNANLIQVNDVNNAGYVQVEKESAPIFRLDYALWSSPVSGETLKGFSPNTLDNRFYHYNPATDAYTPVAGTTEFAEGSSYLIRVDNTHPAYDAATNYTGTPWAGTYIGTPNNGNVTVDASTGYNAVGNPYPSPINIAAFYSANSANLGSDAALYFWRKKNGSEYSSYASLTLAGYTANGQVISTPSGNVNYGDASNGQFSNASQSNTWVLNPGQGFIVQSNGNDIVFNNAMRRPVNNGQLFDIPEVAPSRLWIDMSDATGSFHQAMIAYTENGTLGIDYAMDGRALTDGAIAIYSLLDDIRLGIQARPSFSDTDVVPMGYKAANAGTYTISLHNVEGVFAQDQDIFLRDNLLGTTHDLKAGSYQFTTEAGTFAGRFDVIYAQPLGTAQPVADANSVIAYKNGNAISISSGAANMTGVTVYDTRGRMLYNATGINATETTVSGLQAQQQVLIVKVTTDRGTVTKKIIF